MRATLTRRLLFPLVCVLTLVVPVAVAQAQVLGCNADLPHRRIDMGIPDAEGVNRSVELGDPSSVVGFHFSVKEPGAAALYIGDQLFDVSLTLYARGRCPDGSTERLVRAWSARAEKRVIQFMRPNEQIVNLGSGDYVMIAKHDGSSDRGADPFDPTRPFTARVALNAPYCALAPPDEMVPNPIVPSILIPRRSDDQLYQLALSVSPPEVDRGPFALLSVVAFLTPPYTDLYDFSWILDGRARPDITGPTLQIPVTDLVKTAGGQHQVKLTATGARPYPDPEFPSVPPTLSVDCTFKVGG